MLRRHIPGNFTTSACRRGAAAFAATSTTNLTAPTRFASTTTTKNIDEFCQSFLGAENIQNRSAEIKAEIAQKSAELQKLDKEWNRAMASSTNSVWWIAAGIGVFLAAQWAVLANWVFVMFDWNLVEPVTYFLAASCGWFGTVWYAVSGQDWTYEGISAAMASRFATKKVMKADPQFLQRMEKLQEELAALEAAQNSTYIVEGGERL